VNGDDLPALCQQRLVDGDEVADRGLRGGDRLTRLSETLVEPLQVGYVRLALLLALDADVETDQMDVVLGDQFRRQVGGRVGDDRGRGQWGVLPCPRRG
jgi:hypothetical protein